MSDTQTRVMNVFAPAKINLYLHITGRLENGYHTLDSLVTFADIGDHITIRPTENLTLDIEGPYANVFTGPTRDTSKASDNLVIRAIHALAESANQDTNLHITLNKALPVSAGIGGGSADAAATLWGLLDLWDIPANSPYLQSLMIKLGADVTACFSCKPIRLRGIGDILDPVSPLPEIPVILVNPHKVCPTADVFGYYQGEYKEPIAIPDDLGELKPLVAFLEQQTNDLFLPATQIVPEIKNIIRALEKEKGCALARLSGSGATCFGLFENSEDAHIAAQTIQEDNPDWWVKTGLLNRPERY